ncbi:hypothetical protein F4677DRAFT_137963 [Hypoxylon crocopeplum]|nr:hypothetical protein F4677DRAFT_137963 [Hypoxylon crocopeplum]
MTDLASEQPLAEDISGNEHRDPPPFAPIFTLVNNTSTRTTHHPHVRYIFSDDDPDILTQALADLELEPGISESTSVPTPPHNRAMILDLEPDHRGGYNIAWASSLSSSWAVLDAQLSQISQPSSDGGSNNGNDGGDSSSRADRLMLWIDGTEGDFLGAEVGLSPEASRHGSGSGSSHNDRNRGEPEDYTNLVDKFERQMVTLRKIVDAGEERRRKIAVDAYAPVEPTEEVIGEDRPAD